MKNILVIIAFSLILAACGNDTESIETTNMSDKSCDFLTKDLLKTVFPNASEIKQLENEYYMCLYTFKIDAVEYGINYMLLALNDPNYKTVFEQRVLPLISRSEEQLTGIGEKAYYTNMHGELIVMGNRSVMQMTLSGGDKKKEMSVKLTNALLNEFTK